MRQDARCEGIEGQERGTPVAFLAQLAVAEIFGRVLEQGEPVAPILLLEQAFEGRAVGRG
jgi:hypothetical protein